MADTQYFLTQDGQLKAVAPTALGLAKDSGWKPLGTDIAAARAARDAGSATGQLKTFGEAAGSGAIDALTAVPRLATAGYAAATGQADPLADLTGRNALQTAAYTAGGEGLQGAQAANEYAARARQRAEVNPGVATAGSITGQVAGAVATGGAASGLGGAVTKRLGGGLLARLAGAGAAGAAEGAPLGMIQAQDEAYLQGRQLTAERSVAAAGVGALIGVGLGAGAKGLGEVFGAARSAVGKVDGSLLRKAAGTSDEAIKNTVASTLGEDVVSEDVVQHVREGLGGKNLATVRAETEGAAARDMRSAVNQIEESTKNLTPEWRELKPGNVAKTIATDDASVVQQSEIVRERLATIRERVDAMKADPIAYGERAGVNKLESSLQLAERKANAALESGDMSKAYTALDTLKRDMGPIGRKNALVSADQAAVAEVRDLYQGLRQDLTHEAWGGAGAMQQKSNAAFEEWLSTKHLFDRQFMTETGKEGWQKTYGADPAKLESWVGGLGQARNDLKHAIVDQHLEATQKLARALSEAGELTPAKAAELKSIESSAQRFQATVTKVQKQVSAVDQAQNFIATTAGSHGAFSGATIAGSVLGGLPGAAVGMGLDAVMNPGKFLAQKLRFEQMAVKTTQRLGTALDGFFAPIGGKAARAAEFAQEAAPVARRAAVTSALGAFGSIAKTPELAFEKRRDELEQASQDYGRGVRDSMTDRFGHVAEQDPHTFAAAVNVGSSVLDFLRGKMPMSGPDPESLTPTTTQLKPSRVEVQDFAETWNAVNDPVSVVEAMADGHLPSVDAIEAIQTVFPNFYQQMQTETMARLRKMDEAGQEVPIHQRMMLDTLLGLDGAGEPTFAPSFGAKYGPTMGAPPPDQGPPPGRKGGQAGGIGKRLQTQTQTMIGG